MINLIVSGIERSGTSMMMQVLLSGKVPVAFDESRPPDQHNPRGYFELEGGKIINRLIDGDFPLERYSGKFIKITAYGLKFLPSGNYKVIYMNRDLDKVIASMEHKAGTTGWEKDKPLFQKLDSFSRQLLVNREDMEFLVVNYFDVMNNTRAELLRINVFLENILDVEAAMEAVDHNVTEI